MRLNSESQHLIKECHKYAECLRLLSFFKWFEFTKIVYCNQIFLIENVSGCVNCSFAYVMSAGAKSLADTFSRATPVLNGQKLLVVKYAALPHIPKGSWLRRIFSSLMCCCKYVSVLKLSIVSLSSFFNFY